MVLQTLGVIFLIAFMVEALTEAVLGQLFDRVPVLQNWKWTLMYAAMAVGIVASFIYQFDLVSLLGMWLGVNIPLHAFGMVLTGLAIGRGANFIHDIITKFFAKS